MPTLRSYANYSDIPYPERCRVYMCMTRTIGQVLDGLNMCDAHAVSERAICSNCEVSGYRPYMYGLDGDPNRNAVYCGRCLDGFPYCDDCDTSFHPNAAAEHAGHGPGDLIHNDGYKPYPFKLHGRGKLHMGFELEIPCGDNVGVVLNEHFQDNETSIYAKTDGSVYDGYELVTHPRTLASYQEWDWSWLDAIVHNAGAYNPDTGDLGHGLHVHLAKDAFDTPQHMGRFYLFYRRRANQEFIEHMAGRQGNDWASFYSMRNVTFNDIVAGRCRGARYAVLNMCNEKTIEFRLGCATVDKVKILGLLEFLAATVEYTEKLEATHEKHWEKLIAWVKRGSRRRQTYANFLAVAESFESASLRVRDDNEVAQELALADA